MSQSHPLFQSPYIQVFDRVWYKIDEDQTLILIFPLHKLQVLSIASGLIRIKKFTSIK